LAERLVEVKDLKMHFPIKSGIFRKAVGYVYAVDGVSFFIDRGRTLGLVGESGCGKTTTGMCVLHLYEPTAGEIYFHGEDILRLNRSEMRKLRCKMQVVFQDPYASLDPRMTIEDAISEPLAINRVAKGAKLHERVLDAIEEVGLSEDHLHRFPHEFSGGQRQRICIARALVLKPELLVLDEPTSSLDVSVQAQVLNILKDLQESMGLTYLFISHDLSVIKYVSNKIAVMYLGKIVELSPSEEIFEKAEHPYTKALISAIPLPDPDLKGSTKILRGEVPSPINPPSGCRFHPRCPYTKAICRKMEPKSIDIGNGHLVACHLVT